MAVYGVYGNHELESAENSMSRVTPLLTNRKVCFGTEDGSIGDGSIAYYFFDKDAFRFICLDTNYSYSEQNGKWEHNTEKSYGAPKGNLYPDSLGPVQIAWLARLLEKTADDGMHAVLLSHAALGGAARRHSPDAAEVRAIIDSVNRKKPHTVIMSVNGHYHTNHVALENGVVYLDTNTVRNGYWHSAKSRHYTDESFVYVDYDSQGIKRSERERLVSELRMSENTWYFDRPLYTAVSLSTDGEINIEGAEVGWFGGIDPNPELFADPSISDFRITL